MMGYKYKEADEFPLIGFFGARYVRRYLLGCNHMEGS